MAVKGGAQMGKVGSAVMRIVSTGSPSNSVWRRRGGSASQTIRPCRVTLGPLAARFAIGRTGRTLELLSDVLAHRWPRACQGSHLALRAPVRSTEGHRTAPPGASQIGHAGVSGRRLVQGLAIRRPHSRERHLRSDVSSATDGIAYSLAYGVWRLVSRPASANPMNTPAARQAVRTRPHAPISTCSYQKSPARYAEQRTHGGCRRDWVLAVPVRGEERKPQQYCKTCRPE
jgi:hypothetical protein